jgi:hypothetical protein
MEPARKFADGQRVLWRKRIVTIRGARLDYPYVHINWTGELRCGAFKEWHYVIRESGHEILEHYLLPLENS